MINVWSVAQALEDMGAISEADSKRIVPFCLSACATLTTRLRQPKFEDNPAVIMACAGLALYNFAASVGASDEDFSSFKAGDITISRSSQAQIENAEKFRHSALVSAVPFLTDIDFVFEAVEI